MKGINKIQFFLQPNQLHKCSLISGDKKKTDPLATSVHFAQNNHAQSLFEHASHAHKLVPICLVHKQQETFLKPDNYKMFQPITEQKLQLHRSSKFKDQ